MNQNKRNSTLFLLLLIFSIGLSGCAKKTISTLAHYDSMQILNSKWKLNTLNSMHASKTKSNAFFVLSQNNNKIIGFTGCNDFSGEYELQQNKNRIIFTRIISTRMACMKNKSVEYGFLSALAKTQYYSFENRKLTILNSDKEPLASFIVTE
ncbi:MAG: META domain-containing protein [Gammaproteobacteria bacterium]|nr:META domain-containing protein [Gammaproteobacteria bacterium]